MQDLIIRTPCEADAGRVEELLAYIAQLHREGRPDLFIGSGAKFDRAGVLALFADESSPVFVAVCAVRRPTRRCALSARCTLRISVSTPRA